MESSIANASSKLARAANRTYSGFVWSMSFGLVSIASLPMVAFLVLALGAFKSANDGLQMAISSRSR